MAKRNVPIRRAAAGKTRKTTTAAPKTAARAVAPRKTRSIRTKKPTRMASALALVRGTGTGALSALVERLPWGGSEDDPIRLLEADHRRFEALLKAGEETTARAAKTRMKVLDTLTTELNLHELLEEQVLYPALAPHAETRKIVLEGYQEHHVADLIVGELYDLATRDEQWGPKFKVLKENIEHHIEEEEQDMFRKARAVLSREELAALGRKMRALRTETKKPKRARK
jgi:hypothetical protein